MLFGEGREEWRRDEEGKYDIIVEMWRWRMEKTNVRENMFKGRDKG